MNSPEHRLAGAAALGAVAALLSPKREDAVPYAAAGCVGGYCFSTLPDLIEPATNPHHRQFFHSLVFAGALAYGLYKLYQWEPETPGYEVLRVVGLLAGGAYLVHLAFDATTKRSLPLIGRAG